MSNYSDPITATGSLISVQNRFGGLVDSLSVPITPDQDLHGYSKPWAAGAGKNLLPSVDSHSSNNADGRITFTRNPDGSYTVTGPTVTSTRLPVANFWRSWSDSVANQNDQQKHLPNGTYYFDTGVNGFRFQFMGSNTAGNNDAVLIIPTAKSGTITIDNTYAYNWVRLSIASGTNTNTTSFKPLICLNSEADKSFEPYANVCPISGSTGVDVYVSPTQDQQDATTYASDWTADAGTVYGGTVNLTTGELTVDRIKLSTTWGAMTNDATYTKTERRYLGVSGGNLYDKDNDKRLAAISNLSEAVINATLDEPHFFLNGGSNNRLYLFLPIGTSNDTAVEFCYYLKTPVTYQLTAQDVSLLIGQNYLWASTSEVLAMIYRLWLKDRETGATSIGKNAESLTVTPQFNGVSKVVINITPELAYEAGNDTGRTITIDCPWGTQAMANNLLTMLEGFQYQPYEAENALLDPSAELGDGLTVNGVYGGIFKMTVRSGVLHAVDVSSPQDEEIDHEYPFVASSERKIERQLANVKSELSVQADQISAKVDREGGDPSSVSWEMNADQFKILSDGSEVLIIDDNGLTVNGDGNFTGDVHAGNIKYGGSSGHFSGSGISSKSIGTGQTNDGINTSLGNADYSAGVFSGANEASFVKAKNLYCVGEFKYNGTVFAPAIYYVLDGNDNKVKVRLFKQKDNPS